MKRVMRRWLAMGLAVMVTLISLATPAAADDEGVDASFYKLSSVMSGYLSTTLSDNKSLPDTLTAANGGALLGYSDEADSSGLITGWIISALSHSSATFEYNTLASVAIEGDTGDGIMGVIQAAIGGRTDNVQTRSLWEYTQYGKLLRKVGLDKTSAENSLSNIVRFLSGWLIRLAYYMASTVDQLFQGMVKILQILNPFRFFKLGKTPFSDYGGTLVDEKPFYWADDPDTESGLANIARNLGSLMETVRSWQPLIIAFMLAVMITSILLTKKSPSEGKQQFKRFIIRLTAIVLALPLCASLYTDICSDLVVSNGEGVAQKAILRTFVDFSGWVQTSGLNPSKAQYKVSDGHTVALSATITNNAMTVSDDTQLYIRDIAREINRSCGIGDTASQKVEELLDRYISGEFYYASNYEGLVRSFGYEYTTKDGGKPGYDKIAEATSSPGKVAEDDGKIAKDLLGCNGDFVPAINPVGAAKNGVKVSSALAETSGTSWNTVYTFNKNTPLSDLSVYNYLTSSFGDTGVVVYSNEKAASGFVRQSHYSVNLVGTSFHSFLFWLDCLVYLITAAWLGWFFALSIILMLIRRFVHLCITIPFAMLGSLKSIARLIIYTVMLFTEFLITILVYYLMVGIIASVPDMITQAFVGILNTALSPLPGSGPQVDVNSIMTTETIMIGGEPMAIHAVGGIIVVIVVLGMALSISLLMMGMKLRKSTVKFVDEMITEFVEKILGVKAAPESGGSGALGRAAGAMAAGVGAGMAQKSLATNKDESPGQKDTAGVTEKPGASGPPATQGGANGGGGGGPSGSGEGKDAGAGDAALATEGSTVNVNDADTATARFEGGDEDERNEMEEAEGMQSLAGDEDDDGNQALVAAEDGDDGETPDGPEAGDDADADAEADADADAPDGPEAGDDAEADAEAEAKAAGVDDVDDVAAEAGDAATDSDGDSAGDADGEDTDDGDAAAGPDGEDDGSAAGPEGADRSVAAGDSATDSQADGQADGKAGGKAQGTGGAKSGQATGDAKTGQSAGGAKSGQKAVGAAGQKDGKQSGKVSDRQTAGTKGEASGNAGKPNAGKADAQKGVAAVSGDGKPTGEAGSGSAQSGAAGKAGKTAGDGAKGASGNGSTAAVPAGGSSESLSEAKARRDATAARLNALKSDMANGQSGAGSLPSGSQAGGKAGVLPEQPANGAVPMDAPGQGSKATPAMAASGQDGKATPAMAAPAQGVDAPGQKGTAPSGGRTAVPAGGKQAAVGTGANGQAQGQPMGGSKGAAALEQPNGSSVGTLSQGQAGAGTVAGQAPSAMPSQAGAASLPGQSPKGVEAPAMPGKSAAPVAAAGRAAGAPEAMLAGNPQGGMTPGGSRTVSVSGGAPVSMSGGTVPGPQGGMAVAAPVGNASGEATPVSGAPGTPAPGITVAGAMGAEAPAPMGGQASGGNLPAPAAGQPVAGEGAQPAAAGQSQPSGGAAPVPAGHSTAVVAGRSSVKMSEAEYGEVAMKRSIRSKTTVKTVAAGAEGGSQGVPPSVANRSVAGVAAQAAIAAFMASSDNAALAAVGQGALVYQQGLMSGARARRGTAMVGEVSSEMEVTEEVAAKGGVTRTFESEAEGIAAYDAETAALEEQIAMLEAQRGTARASGGQKRLPDKGAGQSDEFV